MYLICPKAGRNVSFSEFPRTLERGVLLARIGKRDTPCTLPKGGSLTLFEQEDCSYEHSSRPDAHQAHSSLIAQFLDFPRVPELEIGSQKVADAGFRKIVQKILSVQRS